MAQIRMTPSVGYCITKKGDTLKGKFWLREDTERNRLSPCFFRKEILCHAESSTPFSIEPEDVDFIAINSDAISQQIIKSLQYESNKFCFALVVVEGELTYYSACDNYSEPTDGSFFEGMGEIPFIKLKDRELLRMQGSVVSNREYLANYLQDYPGFLDKLNAKRRNWKFDSYESFVKEFNKFYAEFK